ncbi:MAG: 3-deoxy-8-phosphooctulonate synthase [Bacteroidales bacterium]|jgi:2-dehydro-3-deoxyphosphooctonate aldolase (KDO 8-P synthase)|nr:3-deoxy-8-phosphooctulonate synthase [Bacteroidales bacterium]HOO66127.1 3-deoxy-8-phosphooctulonate synthase [Bacteroidales bacterium]HPE22030.1 3-deoxy-8-phosphooctulonate synthase [Bacteroidales bacterium]HPJ05000.1 3-deoxy-8-phosphooctulonate synthase [Bacteroidales bacterium]HPQ63570.1 3-deoxy-8-phosphooctulonate synthase [Bacteroidales bacterium]
MKVSELNIPLLKYIEEGNFMLLAGPCVVESEEMTFRVAAEVKKLSDKYRIPLVFKSSYRKANRSRLDSFTGIGDKKALEILAEVRSRYSVPVVTDIHSPEEARIAAGYVDMLQIPAFLCRQTDLLVAAAETGKVINVKKGQFLSGAAMRFAAGKIRESGNERVILTERGSFFGYNDLVVDMRNIPVMQKTGAPVVMDITHSLQQPNQEGGVSGGQPDMIETIGRCAIAAGADGIFIETHPEPATALSDGANMLRLDLLDSLLHKLTLIRATINTF